MGAQQGKERGSHSGSHHGTASCIGISSSSPVSPSCHAVGVVGVGSVNALQGSTLRASRIKSSTAAAAAVSNAHRAAAAAASAAAVAAQAKDNRNAIGMNIFTEHNA